MNFFNLIYEHESDFEEVILEAVELVLTNSRHNIGRIRSKQSSDHNKLTACDVKLILSFCRHRLKPFHHGYVLCHVLKKRL